MGVSQVQSYERAVGGQARPFGNFALPEIIIISKPCGVSDTLVTVMFYWQSSSSYTGDRFGLFHRMFVDIE